jgi:hypothetical protein
MSRAVARATFAILVSLVGFAVSSCGGGHSTSTEPVTKGLLAINESGCACVQPPYPSSTVYVDGVAGGTLATFGSVTIPLDAGPHTWAVDASNGTVTIVAGQTSRVHLYVNLGCEDGCTDPNPPT